MHNFPRILSALSPHVSTPAPIVLIDVVAENIARMQAFAVAHGKAVRPHVKTHKSVRIGQMQLDAGAIGLTAGNLSEAEIFAAAGCSDIFLAYPVWITSAKEERLRRLARATRLSVGAESASAVERIAATMGDRADTVGIVIEVDCGARRSGVRPEGAGALAAYAGQLGLRPLGIFTYPGHGGTIGARESAARDQAVALRSAVASLRAHGVEPKVVSAGSTPTAEFSIDPVITEIRPGEYVFNDWDNVRLGDCRPDDIALFLATTVVSDQGHGHVIVDAGTKALAREGNADRGFGQVPSYDGYLKLLNEYHGFLQLPAEGARPAVGEVVPVVPNHVCPVINSFEELIITDRTGVLRDRWPVDAQGQLN